jgi:murein DD-endopeptidase MepM/ murein hydrolase activator NlpD
MSISLWLQKSFFIAFLIATGIFFINQKELVYADTIGELQEQIKSQNSEIKKLEAEIAKYEKELSTTKTTASSLTATIARLNTTKKKLETDLSITQKRINALSLNITRLGIDISDKKERISLSREALGESLRAMRENESMPFLASLFTYNSLGDFWAEVDRLETLQGGLSKYVDVLEENKTLLQEAKTEAEKSQDSLKKETLKLKDQQALVLINQKETSTLLSVTKNKQSEYEKLLADRKEKKRLFEEDLRKAEDALKVALDPTSIPSYRAGVLSWPLDRIVVSQYFGDTPFSRSNPQIYANKGHNGVDFGAPEGTAIKAARAGTILGVGNTDFTCPGASYGQWVMIRHDNGLNTLYAHLSLNKVSNGQVVKEGEVIGYVGQTGYATGPHLHFTVFATEGVAISSLPSRGCPGKNYVVPLPTKTGAVLNPLLYLPDVGSR